MPPFEPHEAPYSPVNALWLAEVSRLIYRRDVPGEAEKRDDVLARVGWRERRYIDHGCVQCALLGPRDASAAPCTVLVFRGTCGRAHWRANLNTLLCDCSSGGRVHRGFAGALDQAWPQIEAALNEGAGPLFYTGHSLGGALAVLAAARKPPRAVYVFGCPRVGDAGFVKAMCNVPVYRIVNNRDLVAAVPPTLGPLAFRPHGELRRIQRDSTVEVNPTGRQRGTQRHAGDTRARLDPPRCLADHAPINYVAHLQRAPTILASHRVFL